MPKGNKLPAKITIAGKATIEYLYDAAGVKLKKTVFDTDGNEDKSATQVYVGSYIYDGNGQLLKTLHDEGVHYSGWAMALFSERSPW